MRRQRVLRAALVAGLIGAGLEAGAQEPSVGLLPPPPARQDAAAQRDRSIERLVLDCSSRISRQEVTLFANGTIRRRVGRGAEEVLTLAELAPAELDAYLNRLAEIELTEEPAVPPTVEGDWIETCRLARRLPGETAKQARVFHFTRTSSLSLALGRLVRLAEELGALAFAAPEGLPAGYEARPGDVLEHQDGTLFEVKFYSADGRGLELQAVDSPLVIYIAQDNLRGVFTRLVRRVRQTP